MEEVSKKNPKKDPELVATRTQEIKNWLDKHREQIEKGELILYIIDECHLLWGNICGYVWGRTDKRIEVPIVNEKEKQTYFGAVNYQSQEFFLKAYPTANGEHTIDFINYLRAHHPNKRIAIIWDGASYHKGKEFQAYLQSLNQDKTSSDSWLVTCLLFAPNAPEQNPVEDIWLQAKNFVRQFYCFGSTFAKVKRLFELVTHRQVFNFPKLHKSAAFSQII